ncbi:porin family protein [Hoeflea sp. G2-23]|uniref:Porin family protein n=1 Tax=Hoeflea algicola TaxID=2983763 RepID=A0ABT3Z3B9_9HYPH|nr:outer membrane protein [Hoeflea algicola]MCY0146237.1 porin family protein [Hoeflea algicola]
MKYKLAAAIMLVASTSSVSAADVSVDTVPGSDWNGVFVGVHAGYAWGQSELRNSSPPGPPARTVGVDQDSFIGGVQAGYNWQMNSMVFGVVGDLSFGGMSGATVNVPPPGPPFTATADLDWMGTARLRAGYLVMPETLVYAHGGLAVGGLKGSWLGGPFSGTGSSTQAGWTLGAGFEHKFTQNISMFAEYAYTDFGTAKFSNAAAPAINFRQDADFHTIKFGLNYHF